MSDRDWNAWFRERHARRKAAEEEALRRAEAEAHARGKEPFDAERLRQLYHPWHSVPAPGDDPESRRLWEQEYRYKYYVDFPDAMTIEEFARLLNEMDPYL